MIRRLVTFAVAGLCALSLLASLATGALWWRSYRVGSGGGDCVSRYVAWRQARYTLVSHRGKLILYAPPSDPPKGRAVDGVTAKDVAAGLTNGDIEWRAYAKDEHLREGLNVLAWGVGRADALNNFDSRIGTYPRLFSRDELVPPLLRALEDPGKFVAAHYGLHRLDRGNIASGERLVDGLVQCEFEHLRVELRPETLTPGTPLCMFSCTASIDPAQLPAIRDQWHRRLDVQLAAAPHSWLVAATALLPVLWAGAGWKALLVRRRRRLLGLCRRCGYDLRATGDRCPECGETARRVRATQLGSLAIHP